VTNLREPVSTFTTNLSANYIFLLQQKIMTSTLKIPQIREDYEHLHLTMEVLLSSTFFTSSVFP